jgi:hypothetical protein
MQINQRIADYQFITANNKNKVLKIMLLFRILYFQHRGVEIVTDEQNISNYLI